MTTPAKAPATGIGGAPSGQGVPHGARGASADSPAKLGRAQLREEYYLSVGWEPDGSGWFDPAGVWWTGLPDPYTSAEACWEIEERIIRSFGPLTIEIYAEVRVRIEASNGHHHAKVTIDDSILAAKAECLMRAALLVIEAKGTQQ